jgi:aerotaxis receptor
MAKIYKDQTTNEWYYPDNAYILSETDDKGTILYANDIFCEIAGYDINELIGEPHNIVRHEDMPRIAFKGLWDDIQSKGFWSGIVKNRRKDGGYYWVHATVLRKIVTGGIVTYLSIRTKPKQSDINECEVLYAELRSNE